MRRLLRNTAILAATMLPFITMSACAGVTARTEVMLPAMSAAYEGGLRDNILAGISPSEVAELVPLADAMSTALKSGDPAAVLRIDWPQLMALALAGIDWRLAAGEIGPGVADSLRERVRLFNRSFQLLRQ